MSNCCAFNKKFHSGIYKKKSNRTSYDELKKNYRNERELKEIWIELHSIILQNYAEHQEIFNGLLAKHRDLQKKYKNLQKINELTRGHDRNNDIFKTQNCIKNE
jgi:hypothetical protein